LVLVFLLLQVILVLLMLLLEQPLPMQLPQVILQQEQLLPLGFLLLEPLLQVLRQYFQPQLMQQLLPKVHHHRP